MPILTVEHISKSYEGHTALSDVSLQVDEGSVFGLLGPNGAGKTTLIRIINQIIAPDNGSVTLLGESLQPKHVEQIGYLPEERGLYRKMKVGEQALYLAQLKGVPKQEAKARLKQWFEKFDLTTWWDKKVEELSKGMAQKIQFIVTVLHEPKLLILDEPFSGFDPINTNLIKKEIEHLRENGTTVIFSTHNMASVEEICDHIALINNAHKLLDGPVKEIKEKYGRNVYEVKFKGHMIAFTNALWTGAKLLEKEEVEPGINRVRIEMLEGFSVNALLNAIIQFVEVISVNEILPSMNDIFIETVEQSNTNNGEDRSDH